jgi:hypothetical protein
MAVNFLLKRSSVADKRPTALQLDIGELSLNYDQGTPGLFFEDDAGNVRKVGPTEVGGTAPNVTPAGQSGNSTGEMWLDNSSTPLLKTWDGSAWRVAGATTIGSTAIALGSSSTTLAGLTSVTSTNYTASTAIDLSNQADLRFYEATVNGANYVGFQAPSTIGSDVLWTLPATDGTSGQVLRTDGSGTLSWVSPGAASAGGSNTQVQFNSGGTLAGSSNFTWDGATLRATLLTSTQSSGDEGGQLDLAAPATNTSIATGVSIDVYQNRLRIFETSGSNRGISLDITAQATGVGGTLATSASKLSLFAATTSAELAGVISDETGSGSLVFGTAPSFTTSATFANQAEARFAETTGNGTNYVALRGASSIASNVTFTLPPADGTNGQVLQTDGSGALSFVTVSTDFLQSKQVISTNTTVPTLAGYNQAALYSLEIAPGVTFTVSPGERFSIIDS